jgi:hypothetical protein
MKKLYLAAACSAVLLTLGSFATGQGTGTGGSSGRDLNQCWDQANQVVRDVKGTGATGPSGTNSSTIGKSTEAGPGRKDSNSSQAESNASLTEGSGQGSPSAAPSESSRPSESSANAKASTRPAGIPNC